MRRQLILRGARSNFVHNAAGMVHFFEVKGTGRLPPVVLIHGFSAAAATQYGQMMRMLRPHFSRIVAPDLPGHGMSVLPEQGISGPVMINAIRDALDAALSRPAIIFGSSLGGAVAVRFAAQHPDKVLKLILCSPGGAPIPEHEMTDFISTFRIDNHRDALRFVDNLFPHGNRLRHLFAFGIRHQFNRPQMVELINKVRHDDFLRPEEVQSLTMPVLLIWGKGERILPNHNLEFFRENLRPHAQIEEPDGFGHAPFLDQGEKVAARIIDFARAVHHRSVLIRERHASATE